MDKKRINRVHKSLVGLSVVAMFMAVMSFSSSLVAAEPPSLTVGGHVYDPAGDPISGASVTILIVETSASRVTVTDALGYYDNALDEFDASEYSDGDTIRVTATYNSESAYAEDYVGDDGVVAIDVHFTYEIPEFGSLAGTVVAMAAIAIIGSVLFAGRRKRSA